jgi:uncharacterized protein (DUF1810 family)
MLGGPPQSLRMAPEYMQWDVLGSRILVGVDWESPYQSDI